MESFVKYGIGAVAIVALVLGYMALNRGSESVLPPPFSGAGADTSYSCESHNGVTRCFNRIVLNQASTTICSIQSPRFGTSTLVSGGVQITTGTTTTIALELGKSTLFDATTTRISYDASIASAAQETLTAFVASTTGVYGTLGQQHTADEQDVVFAPGAYLNAKYGGAAGILNVLKGSCTATFELN